MKKIALLLVVALGCVSLPLSAKKDHAGHEHKHVHKHSLDYKKLGLRKPAQDLKRIGSMDEFNTFIATGLSLVMFHALSWCGACQVSWPHFNAFIENNNNPDEETRIKDVKVTLGLKVGDVDIDANKDIANANKVHGVPTTILFKDGKEIARKVDALTTVKTYADFVHDHKDK